MGVARVRMRPRLTTQQVQDYVDERLLHRIGVLGADEVAHYSRQHDRAAGFFGAAPRATQMSQVHRFYLWASQLTVRATVLDAVESGIGPGILHRSAAVFRRLPTMRAMSPCIRTARIGV